MDAKKAWTDLQGYVDAGPATGKEGDGNPNAVKAKVIGAHDGPDWDDTKGYVHSGPGAKGE